MKWTQSTRQKALPVSFVEHKWAISLCLDPGLNETFRKKKCFHVEQLFITHSNALHTQSAQAWSLDLNVQYFAWNVTAGVYVFFFCSRQGWFELSADIWPIAWTLFNSLSTVKVQILDKKNYLTSHCVFTFTLAASINKHSQRTPENILPAEIPSKHIGLAIRDINKWRTRLPEQNPWSDTAPFLIHDSIKNCLGSWENNKTRVINSSCILSLYFSAARYYYDMYFSSERLCADSRIPGRLGSADGWNSHCQLIC